MTKADFKIFRCGIAGLDAVESDTRHVFPRHTHEQFGIGVIYRGAQKSHSGRGMVEAGSGDTITVNPGEVHDGAPIGDAGRAWRMLYFNPALIAEATRDISEGKTRIYEFCRPVISDAGVSNRFQKLFSIVTRGNERKTAIQREELLLMLLPNVMREHGRPDEEQSAPKAIFNAKSPSGLSRFQVLRGFVRATGLTPHAYIVQRRINIARRLIAHGAPLAEAAVASGFADQSHMTRIFVRKYGISPRAYADAVI